jgi:AraC-like DNA-binding protein
MAESLLAIPSSQWPTESPAKGPLKAIFREFEDCHEHAEMSSGEANAEFTQLSAGRHHGASVRLELEDVRVLCTETSGTTLNRMRTQESLLYYTIPISAQGLLWDGRDLSGPEVIQHAKAHEAVRRARDFVCVSIAVPKDRFLRDAAALAGVGSESIRLETRILEPASPAARGLFDLAVETTRQSRRRDSRLGDPDYLDALRQRIERSVLEILMEQIGIDERGVPPPVSRKKTVLRALEYLEGATDAGVNVTNADLCRAAGVSERALRYAFQEVCGVSPQRFVHIRRLRAARMALLASDGSRGAVKVAAYDAGFRELGRFSVQYREFFGESPRETAARQKKSTVLVAGGERCTPEATAHA